jgi:hypothetical protein
MSQHVLEYYKRKLAKRRSERQKIFKIDKNEKINEHVSSDEEDECDLSLKTQNEIEIYLLKLLKNPLNDVPINSNYLLKQLEDELDYKIPNKFLIKLIQSLENNYKLINIKFKNKHELDIIQVNTDRVRAYSKRLNNKQSFESDNETEDNNEKTNLKRKHYNSTNEHSLTEYYSSKSIKKANKIEIIETLLSKSSIIERETKQNRNELTKLVNTTTAQVIFTLKNCDSN